jgi:hypothetical protein
LPWISLELWGKKELGNHEQLQHKWIGKENQTKTKQKLLGFWRSSVLNMG